MTKVIDSTDVQIRGMVERWIEALRAKNVESRTVDYAPDVVLFDVVGPFQHVGVEALRARLTEWFSTFRGPIDCELRDLHITAGHDVAFCHSLNRFRGPLRDGGQLDMWVRFTVCLCNIDGRWTVTHEHASVPFDVKTGRASMDIAPSGLH
jgi:uncharacterized protein (TIGR02246 family)